MYFFEPSVGLEPTTLRLQITCSTSWAKKTTKPFQHCKLDYFTTTCISGATSTNAFSSFQPYTNNHATNYLIVKYYLKYSTPPAIRDSILIPIVHAASILYSEYYWKWFILNFYILTTKTASSSVYLYFLYSGFYIILIDIQTNDSTVRWNNIKI